VQDSITHQIEPEMIITFFFKAFKVIFLTFRFNYPIFGMPMSEMGKQENRADRQTGHYLILFYRISGIKKNRIFQVLPDHS
jgi:hypothetical protein